MPIARKIVLVTKRDYDPRYDDMLLQLIARRIELFCVVGRECEVWEAVVDELVIGPIGDGEWDVATTSHPGEDVAEVIAFAQDWQLDEPSEVEVIEI